MEPLNEQPINSMKLKTVCLHFVWVQNINDNVDRAFRKSSKEVIDFLWAVIRVQYLDEK